MKIYRNLVNAVADILHDIFKQNRYADKALERAFKAHPQWGSRDRRFVAEGVYEIVRHFRFYSYLAETENNFWFISGVWLWRRHNELPAWSEFRHIDREQLKLREERMPADNSLIHSYPEWLWELGTQELGADTWLKEAVAMNEQAPVYLRVNTLKTNAADLRKKLADGGIETESVDAIDTALVLKKRENVFTNKYFKEGFFEVQDAGSQLIGEFLDPSPRDLVIDACAGAGGKSLQIAAIMKNKGRVVSMDVEERKLEELRRRAKRAGAFNIEARLIDAETIKSFENKASKVLLDVPCSGSGVIKRNPDAKWKLSPQVIERTKSLQAQILRDYCKMVQPEGYLVYSTCSILPSENNQQVEKFLNENSDFKLLTEKTLYPSQGFDGFYMALLRRQL